MLTQTVRHSRADELGPRLDAISHALRSTLNGQGWNRRRDALGYAGAIKAVEVTHGVNGWHPHSHSLLFLRTQPTRSQLRDLERWLFQRWSNVVESKGLGTLDRRHGIDLRPVGSELGSYLTKVEGGWGAGLELARADLKSGRAGRRTPWQMLRDFVETGEIQHLRLWREYEDATAGKRAVVWSRGLRDELLGDQEVSDVEAAAAEGIDVALLRALVPPAHWQATVKAGQAGELLSEFEHVAAALLWLSDSLGHEVVPIDQGEAQRREAAS